MAKGLARVIGATMRKPEWYEGNGYRVTWLYGHILELDVPEAKVSWGGEEPPHPPGPLPTEADNRYGRY